MRRACLEGLCLFQEVLKAHYKNIETLPGCPADYDLPMMQPVVFELRRLNSSHGPLPSQLAASQALAQAQGPQIPGFPGRAGSTSSAQDSSSFLGSFQQLQGAGGSIGGGQVGGVVPPEVLALLPTETQAQIAQAFRTAAQAQALQQALSGPLPVGLAQLLQAQLMPLQQQPQLAALQAPAISAALQGSLQGQQQRAPDTRGGIREVLLPTFISNYIAFSSLQANLEAPSKCNPDPA